MFGCRCRSGVREVLALLRPFNETELSRLAGLGTPATYRKSIGLSPGRLLQTV